MLVRNICVPNSQYEGNGYMVWWYAAIDGNGDDDDGDVVDCILWVVSVVCDAGHFINTVRLVRSADK